jgi:NADH-ubiquinone oxidoreductase chain 6
VISISFYIVLYELVPFSSIEKNIWDIENNKEFNVINPIKYFESLYDNINYLVSNQWDTNLVEILHITSIGNILYTNYFLWLILASIILLLAMIGTIIITIKQ